ncbi:VWA domain-containing protein [Fulvivirga sp. M361]|nr:VWA domain-containing protein [Fulvivirga sp. M361]
MALELNLVDPGIGGVLALGDKGAGKTTIVRSLSQLMSGTGEEFNFINLPIGASEDRVLGAVDLEKLINERKQEVQKGLLTQAHKGILYIDEINLLNDYLTDVLLDAAAVGCYHLEREGLSIWQPSRFCLVGTMNPEEGELRPQLLDRFGLCVDIETPGALPIRKAIVKRRILFDQDPQKFYSEYLEEETRCRESIMSARTKALEMETDDELYEHACNLSIRYQVEGMRADILLIKAGKAYAALQGKSRAEQEDIDKVAPLVLRHRAKNPPKNKDIDNDQNPPNQEQDRYPKNNTSHNHPLKQDEETLNTENGANDLEHFQTRGTDKSLHFFHKKTSESSRKGQKALAMNSRVKAGNTGRSVREIDHRQSVKNYLVKEEFKVIYKTHEQRSKTAIYFLVDSSGSMARHHQVSFVKGVISNTISENKGRHITFATIGMINGSAEIVQTETQNTDQLIRTLEEFRTGGRTSLTHGFRQVSYLLKDQTHTAKRCSLFILTDGKINQGISEHLNPVEEATTYFQRHLKKLDTVSVIDMEKGFVKLGKAAELARKLNARYQIIE